MVSLHRGIITIITTITSITTTTHIMWRNSQSLGWFQVLPVRVGLEAEAERATGEPMSTGPYLAYLQTKYGELYQLTSVEKHQQVRL